MDKVKVYIADVNELNDTKLFRQYYQECSPERKAKIDCLHFERDKKLSLGAELLLKVALQKEGFEYGTILLGEHGKPYMEGVCFNLSHSGDKVMCAISDHEVGCDVEKLKAFDMNIAKRFFCETEFEWIDNQDERFCRLWTLKESFLKATGLGMKLPFHRFQMVMNAQPEGIQVIQDVMETTYYFKEYDLNDGYRYAVCGQVSEFAEPEIFSFKYSGHKST